MSVVRGILASGVIVLALLVSSVSAFHIPARNLQTFPLFSQVSTGDSMTSANLDNEISSSVRSLISSYLVDINQEQNGDHVWSLTPIEDVVEKNIDSDDMSVSSGAKSWTALHTAERQPSNPTITLKSRLKGDTIEIEVQSVNAKEEETQLLFVLVRVLAQFTVTASTDNPQQKKNWTIIVSSKNSKEEISDVFLFSIDGARSLFETDSSIEVVDMVDQEGNVLGMVPRSLVHSLNILHRGVGLTVSKDSDFSELYVHRRTDFKRIFPSLYDMFVGGVSLSGEDSKLTAAREVAEELGLSRALDSEGNPNRDALSDSLFTCVVCTSYNRCVVTVFQYTIKDPSQETISWQEEEVSWGEFVPYNIIEAAADLSIQRLVSKKEWPGMMPAVQSKWEGGKPPNEVYETDDWTTWDFVPDGLLVWEAWLRWREAL